MAPDPEILKRQVLLVDDHPLVREWLATLINQQNDMQVCGHTGDGNEAMALIAGLRPDIAVVDISLEGGSGIELIENIRASHPQVLIIVLSMHDELLYAERALKAGARGYIMKREATKKILPAIRCVLSGKLYFSQKITLMLAEKHLRGDSTAISSQIEQLSDRELEVFQLLGRGLSTRQIAGEMHISFRTVQSFCARIKEKLKFQNATQLLCAAIRWHDSQHLK